MLYGDGIHDDTPAIQALLDSGARLVELPMPDAAYMISKPLVIHSNQELKLPRLAVIRLMDMSNCHMLRNEGWYTGQTDVNVAVTGGVWDYNNRGQLKHPWEFKQTEFPEYDGLCIFLRGIRNLHMTGITMKDPVTFAITLDTVSYFTVEDIVFDFNHGHPWAINMDGVHLNGNCHFGTIRNLKGACYDDLVALNSDEGTCGPISHIDIDGIYAEDCHSAVRLLASRPEVKDVHITNVHGTYFQYCIGVTRFYDGDTGCYDGLVFDNIFASKAERIPIYRKDGTYVYPLLWIEDGLRVKNISVSNLFRTEEITAVSTFFVGEGTTVENMRLSNIVCENRTGEPMPLIDNRGVIQSLSLSGLRTDGDALLAGSGRVLMQN